MSSLDPRIFYQSRPSFWQSIGALILLAVPPLAFAGMFFALGYLAGAL